MLDNAVRSLLVLVTFAAGACYTTSGGGSDEPPGPDPGPPNQRWARVSTRPLEPVARDPGVLACVEPERHSYQHPSDESGWIDRCGWRRHQSCRMNCPLVMAGCSLDCYETTPRDVQLANTVLHVRRLFAATEGCDETASEPSLLLEDHDDQADPAHRTLGSTRWRVLGCDKRGRIRCRPGEHASGAVCERLAFSDEAREEVLDEAHTLFATGQRAECADPKLLGGGVMVATLADGQPGLAFALGACGKELVYACVRPDLVPPSAAACREVPRDSGFIAAAAVEAAKRVGLEHHCQVGSDAVSYQREWIDYESHAVLFRVTACNATRDVRGVKCNSQSLIDGRVRGCWIDSVETETRASLLRAGEVAAALHTACGIDRQERVLISANGDSHVVLVRCYGTRREATFVRCRKRHSDDAAECNFDAGLQAAADALERGARARFGREERCPDPKIETQPIEGRTGKWLLRAEGCGVTSDYVCPDLATSIDACSR